MRGGTRGRGPRRPRSSVHKSLHLKVIFAIVSLLCERQAGPTQMDEMQIMETIRFFTDNTRSHIENSLRGIVQRVVITYPTGWSTYKVHAGALCQL